MTKVLISLAAALAFLAAGMYTERYTTNSSKLDEPNHSEFLVACATQTGATITFCSCLEKEYVSQVGNSLEKYAEFNLGKAVQTCKASGSKP